MIGLDLMITYLEAFGVFLLLLVNDSEPEIDLVGLFEILCQQVMMTGRR